jgi:transcriptional regulator with XRE-family HTH domain
MNNVGERIRELRERNNLDKTEFAKSIGVNKSSITRYEDGIRQPNLDVLIKIKETFGVTLDWLAGFDTDEAVEYSAIVKDCIKSDISSENLNDAVKFIKRQRG